MAEELKNIKIETFATLIKDLSLSPLVSLPDSSNLSQVIEAFKAQKVSSLVLLNEKQGLSGIITEKDFLLKILGKVDNWKEACVAEFMSKDPFTATPNCTVYECIKTMSLKEFRHIPIVDDQGKAVQIISVDDLINHLLDLFPEAIGHHKTMVDWDFIQVDDYGDSFIFATEQVDQLSGSFFMTHLDRVITKAAHCIDVKSSIGDILNVMQTRKISSVLLTEYETKLKGIITERDLLFNIPRDNSLDYLKLEVRDFMTENPHTLLRKHYLAHAINNMTHFKYRNTIIVDEDRVPIGMVRALDILKYLAGYLIRSD